MRPFLLAFLILIVTAALLLAVTVGSGAPTGAIQQSFVSAYNRGQFSQFVVLPPLADVHALGSPGLLQEFQSKANSALKFALVDPDPFGANNTFQMSSDLYTFYINVGQGTAGYPVNDTTACLSNSSGACNYQLFTKDYALFVYPAPFSASYAVADPFYTEWNKDGGIGGTLGPAIGATSAVTSVANTAGTQQMFAAGAIYSYPASSSTPPTYSVAGAIYTAFNSAGGYATLGFPTTEETVLASGLHQQVFESGRIQWTPGSPANVLFPINLIQIGNFAGGLSLNVGATATLTAYVYDTQGNPAFGRTLTWSTTNGNVATVQGSGNTATVTAVGAGAANIYVTGEGKTSNAVSVLVTGQCCGIGQGAPTQAMTQAFQQAAARNRLTVALPNPTGVTQAGMGYIQALAAVSGGTIYIISESPNSAVAYVIGGTLYTAYLAYGGFTGPLGYPASDASGGGTQSFVSGAALGGSPVRLVPVPIAAKWLESGAETGPLGLPIADASSVSSLTGATGNSQVFANGEIFGIVSGSLAGQAFLSSGLILARYAALSGPLGKLGFPTGDPFANGAAQQQNFETGYIDLQPGATAAVEHFYTRTPAVTTTPATAAPGGRVHISITGFAFGATLAVSITGQPGFTLQVPGGEFAWDVVVPASAAGGAVAIQVKAMGSSDAASASYTVTSLAQLQPKLTVVSGDQQTGMPGSTLALPLIAILQDINGNPMPGVPAGYTVSPGASIQGTQVTDANGRITASLRLPQSAGVALVGISAAGQLVGFSALAAANSIQNFPLFTQTSSALLGPGPATLTQQGGLVTSLAALIRYYQNTGLLPSTNGLATPATLNQFLTANSGFTISETGDSIANPWVAMEFAGLAGGISLEPTGLDHIRDLLNAGSPVMLELLLQVDGALGGSAVVDAIGINSDGSIAIMDPNPAFGRTSLFDYLNGFAAQGHTIEGTVAGGIRIVPTLATPNGFVVAAQVSAGMGAASPVGLCGLVTLQDPVIAGQGALASIGGAAFAACDGSQPLYQAGFAAQKGAAIIDLGGAPAQRIAPNSGIAFQIARASGALSVTPENLAIASVVNSAGLSEGLSPGGIFTIFGAGLSTGATQLMNPFPGPNAIMISGQPVTVLADLPFQINAIMPAGVAPGTATLQVSNPIGTATRTITIAPGAPGIFTIGNAPDGQPLGAIVNQDGTINGPGSPALRGQYISIYGTGLGATRTSGSLQVVTSPVMVMFNGTAATPSFAGLTPGIAGLYQINVQVPPAIAPGAEIALQVTQNGQASNTVVLAIQ